MPDKVLSYTGYFRQHAVSHYLLQHNPATETGNGPAGGMRFCRFTPDEIVNGLQSAVSFPALLLQLFDTQLTAETHYDIKNRPRAGFMILQHADSDYAADQEAAYNTAHNIAEQILHKIWQDHYGPGANKCTTPFLSVNFSTVTIIPTGRLFTREYGYMVEFDFEFAQNPAFNQPIQNGIFL
jgi:hypothetical protein